MGGIFKDTNSHLQLPRIQPSRQGNVHLPPWWEHSIRLQRTRAITGAMIQRLTTWRKPDPIWDTSNLGLQGPGRDWTYEWCLSFKNHQQNSSTQQKPMEVMWSHFAKKCRENFYSLNSSLKGWKIVDIRYRFLVDAKKGFQCFMSQGLISVCVFTLVIFMYIYYKNIYIICINMFNWNNQCTTFAGGWITRKCPGKWLNDPGEDEKSASCTLVRACCWLLKSSHQQKMRGRNFLTW